MLGLQHAAQCRTPLKGLLLHNHDHYLFLEKGMLDSAAGWNEKAQWTKEVGHALFPSKNKFPYSTFATSAAKRGDVRV